MKTRNKKKMRRVCTYRVTLQTMNSNGTHRTIAHTDVYTEAMDHARGGYCRLVWQWRHDKAGGSYVLLHRVVRGMPVTS